MSFTFTLILSSGVPEFNCRGIPNCNQPYSFHHKAKRTLQAIICVIVFVLYCQPFPHQRHVQASLADISAEDFKKAVKSTPLAGVSLSYHIGNCAHFNLESVQFIFSSLMMLLQEMSYWLVPIFIWNLLNLSFLCLMMLLHDISYWLCSF